MLRCKSLLKNFKQLKSFRDFMLFDYTEITVEIDERKK